MSDVLAISRLAVAAIPQTSLEFKRALVYQTTAKSLSLRQWPGSQSMHPQTAASIPTDGTAQTTSSPKTT